MKSATDLELDKIVRNATTLYYVQEFDKSRAALTGVLKLKPHHFDALCVFGQVLIRGYEDFEAAREVYRLALKVRPKNTHARVLLAELYSQSGMADEAAAEAKALIADDPKAIGAYRLLAELDANALGDDAMERMFELSKDAAIPAANRRRVLAAAGRVLEKRKQYPAAFDAFARANALDVGEYSPAALASAVANLSKQLTPAFFEERRSYGVKDERNVFVIGMPRSGSTLLEQVMLAHPRVDSCGESNVMLQLERFLRGRMGDEGQHAMRFEFLTQLTKGDSQIAAHRYFKIIDLHIRKKNALRIVNKSLVNFERLPLLRLLFPKARFLHAYRHPLDTLLSCHNQDFMATYFASSFETLAHFFNYYMNMMELWIERAPENIIHVCHEDFVTGFDEKAPKLIEALGLPWDDACGRPHEQSGVVYTASSTQVRKPVNTSGFGRWRRYEAQLAPLIEKLGGLEAIEARYEKMRALSI